MSLRKVSTFFNYNILIVILLSLFTNSAYSAQHKQGSAFFFADVLQWKLREGGGDNWSQLISPAATNQAIRVNEVPFSYDIGYRFGGGYNNPDHSWDIIAYYTRYHTVAYSSASPFVYSSYLGNFYAGNTDGLNFGPYYQSANIRWNYWFNTFDVELGRQFNLAPILLLRPFIGIKTAVINQNIYTNWHGPINPNATPVVYDFTSSTEYLKNDFWGIGPVIGINTAWPLFTRSQYAFNLFGNFSGALLWGHWTFKDFFQTSKPQSVTVNTSNITSAATMMRGLVGLEWESIFSKADVSVRLGYEAQVWFNQLHYYSLNMGRMNNLMSLQGGVVDVGVKF